MLAIVTVLSKDSDDHFGLTCSLFFHPLPVSTPPVGCCITWWRITFVDEAASLSLCRSLLIKQVKQQIVVHIKLEAQHSVCPLLLMAIL